VLPDDPAEREAALAAMHAENDLRTGMAVDGVVHFPAA
jgi:hypothetical protein